MALLRISSPSVSVPQVSFAGGLNTTSGPLYLKDDESPACQNVDFDKFGSVLKRNGYTAVNTSAFNSGATWTSLHWYELSTGSKYMVGTCGNKLANWDSSISGSPTDITGALSITAGNDNHFDWDTFVDVAVGTNGVDAPIQWNGTGNGTTMAVPTNLTTARFVKVYNNYLFLANVTVAATPHPNRVYWSNLKDITTWTATDFVDVNKNDGTGITGLIVLGDKLMIFKDRSIWACDFTGAADVPFTFRQTNSSVGGDPGGGFSIQKTDNGLMFHSQDGFYFFDGNSSEKISNKITATLTNFNQNRYSSMWSVFQREKNRYWAAFTTSGGTTHDRIITYDTYNDAFSLYTGMAANCFGKAYVSGQEKIYFGDYSGFVYRADSGTDDYPLNVQTKITSFWQSKWFDFGDSVNQKGTPEVVIYYDTNTATLTVGYSYDLNNTQTNFTGLTNIPSDTYSVSVSTAAGGALWDSGTWDSSVWGNSGGSIQRLDLDSRGRLVAYTLSNATLSETFKVNGLGKLTHLETNV